MESVGFAEESYCCTCRYATRARCCSGLGAIGKADVRDEVNGTRWIDYLIYLSSEPFKVAARSTSLEKPNTTYKYSSTADGEPLP